MIRRHDLSGWRGGIIEQMLRCVSALLIALGVIGLGYAAYVVLTARHFQSSELERLNHVTAGTKSVPKARIVAEGDTIGAIEIPRLGLNAVIVQGDSDTILRRAVGHVPETALPGETGNIALAGHRDTLFRPLRDIQVGDTITLKTPAGEHTYAVESTEVVPPADLAVLRSTGRNELTLITCFPFHYIGHAPNRFIVQTREVESRQVDSLHADVAAQ